MSPHHYVLGIHDGHNASVCLLENGKVIFAIQEERLNRIKNFWGFPRESVNAAFQFAHLQPKDIDCVALASFHVAKSSGKDIRQLYKEEAQWRGWINEGIAKTPVYDFYKMRRKEERLNNVEQCGLPRARVRFVEHHLCHASSVYYGLPVPRDEKILILTADGSGDGLCATVNIAEQGEIKRIASTDKGHSLGNIYSRVTFLLGYKPWEHEYKLMGLAPYASSRDSEKTHKIFQNYIGISKSNLLQFERKIPEPTHLIYNRIKRDTRLMRADAICGGLQNMLEEVLCDWVKACVRETGIKKIALSGGVFMNVKANKRILELEEVEELFVMPSCGDETNSLGAAYRTYYEEKKSIPASFDNFYLGNDMDDREVATILQDDQSKNAHFQFQRLEDIEYKVAELLSEGAIVARCKGRMEFGARALGNRSILADPKDSSVRDDINRMVKMRDPWMPFAPVVKKERAGEYMVNPKQTDSPYMMMTFDTTQKREELKAAIHPADLTARFQIVDKASNPEYYKIIEEFEKRTGRAVLLNTSFNIHGSPIVCTPRDAMEAFLNSGLKYLALGQYLIWK